MKSTKNICNFFILFFLLSPNDVFATEDFFVTGYQHNLYAIGAVDAWSQSTGSDVRVGVLDSGVNLNHPDLVGTGCLDFIPINVTTDSQTEINVSDHLDFPHGTPVASHIFSKNNSSGIIGAAYDACGLIIRMTLPGSNLYDYMQGIDPNYMKDAIDLAVLHEADFINLSAYVPFLDRLVGDFNIGLRPNIGLVKDAIKSATENNVALFAAAGNWGSLERAYPCSDEKVTCVGAVDESNQPLNYSNYGSPDISAPSNVLSATYVTQLENESYSGSYHVLPGTSMATPQVTAVAALVKSEYPAWSAERIKNTLLATTNLFNSPQIDGLDYGTGIVYAPRALEDKDHYRVKEILSINQNAPSKFQISIRLVKNNLSGSKEKTLLLSTDTPGVRLIKKQVKISRENTANSNEINYYFSNVADPFVFEVNSSILGVNKIHLKFQLKDSTQELVGNLYLPERYLDSNEITFQDQGKSTVVLNAEEPAEVYQVKSGTAFTLNVRAKDSNDDVVCVAGNRYPAVKARGLDGHLMINTTQEYSIVAQGKSPLAFSGEIPESLVGLKIALQCFVLNPTHGRMVRSPGAFEFDIIER